ncbi:hypothetical protein ACIGEZ_17815 [Streptomyces sp. NPDC085481]|uniref:hypothetical protein n=1 Tax=Streptomyces sp. NPDC085481 TaxID=3365727 RepID=UPI0037CF1F45
MRSLTAQPFTPAPRAWRLAVAVLLVFAALLGAGGGEPAAAEVRSAAAGTDVGGEGQETLDVAESDAAAPVRAVKRPAPPRSPRPAARAGDPAPVPVPALCGDAPRSAVMRC